MAKASGSELTGTLCGKFCSILPILSWSRSYNRKWLALDLMAGITLAAFTIPEDLAYASLAGLRPEMGLYATLMAAFIYFLTGTSRQLSVGPTSSLSILIVSVLSGLALDPDQYIASATFTGFLVGIIAILAYLFRFGFLSKLISSTVLTGFIAGAAVYIASSQFATLFGIPGGGSLFIERIWNLISHIYQINPASLALGLAAILILVLMRRKYPKIPWTLVVVIGSILLISFTDLKEMGIAVVGYVPSGLPPVRVPIIPSSYHTTLIALAGGCFLLAYVEQIGIVKALSRENDYDIDEDQELLSLGLSNLANSLVHGFVVGGSYSRSSVNNQLGARTQLAGGITGLIVMVVIVFFTSLLSNLPHTILAAIVLVAVLNLVHISEFKRILYISKPEFAVAMTVFFSVILLGLLPGVLVGMVLSIFELIQRFYRPRTVVMGKVPGSDEFAEVEGHPENEQIDDTMVLKIESNLLFFNADNILKEILHCLTRSPRRVKLLVLNLESSPFIDISATDMIRRLHEVLKKRGIDLKLARASALMTERLEKTGLTSLLNQTAPGETVTKVIDEWQNLSVSTDET